MHGVSYAAGINDRKEAERNDTFVHHFMRNLLALEILVIVAEHCLVVVCSGHKIVAVLVAPWQHEVVLNVEEE